MNRTTLFGSVAAIALGFALVTPALAETLSSPAEQSQTSVLNNGGAVSGTTASPAVLDGNPAQAWSPVQQASRRPFPAGADMRRAQDYDAMPAGLPRALDPNAYVELKAVDPNNLQAAPVEIASGDTVGTVRGVALSPAGTAIGVKIELTNGTRVWVPESALRYNPGDQNLLTNMSRDDLQSVASREVTN